MGVLSGRLGIDTARIPHKSRHGLIFLERGSVSVEDGCLLFKSAGFQDNPSGDYGIPHQGVSSILLGPGTSITHDALRILAFHGTLVMAIGSGGVRIYTSPPLNPDNSHIARMQATLWGDAKKKTYVARKMFAIRFGEVFPHKNLDVLRGIEGARLKRIYSIEASKNNINWKGRKFDRDKPDLSDIPNQALNYIATIMYAAATISVYSIGAIPQLGFIHETSGDAFCLDIADLYRSEITIPVAFSLASDASKNPDLSIERESRRRMNDIIRKTMLIDKMIDNIKDVLNVDDVGYNQ